MERCECALEGFFPKQNQALNSTEVEAPTVLQGMNTQFSNSSKRPCSSHSQQLQENFPNFTKALGAAETLGRMGIKMEMSHAGAFA